jgi:hypothetical protein
MKTIVHCHWCERDFEKENKEINRCNKKGMFHFCSCSCATKYRNDKLPNSYWKNQYKKHPTLRGHENNRLDELSPFRTFLNSGRASILKHKNEITITPEDLKLLWEKQGGICPYTGVRMALPKNSGDRTAKSLRKASLDRIDSSKGYTKNNIEFVCMAINLAKNNHSKEEMAQFIDEIISIRNTLSVTRPQPT